MRLTQDQKAMIQEAQKNFGGCYIAVMRMDGGAIEVETSPDSCFTVGGRCSTVENARKKADRLESIINRMGCNVFYTRKEWEKRF